MPRKPKGRAREPRTVNEAIAKIDEIADHLKSYVPADKGDWFVERVKAAARAFWAVYVDEQAADELRELERKTRQPRADMHQVLAGL